MRDLLSKAAKYRAEARRRKLWQRAVSLLACVVLLFTTYAQILPAITLEQTERLLDCHYAVHEHTAACYDGDELICGQADFVVHTHDKNCYDPSGKLVCPLPEIKTHTHTEACYASLPAESEQEQTPADGAARLICGQKEAEGHTHTDECYETEQVLVCGLEEAEGHTHTDACYEKQLTCTETETEGHTHDEDCYKTTKTLLCINTDTDHIHSEACYDIEQTLICTEDEVPAHEHDDTCYEEVLICGQEEAAAHEHTEACYEERRTLICKKEETKGHTHSEECYAAADAEQLEPEETPAPSAEDEAQERELICGQEEVVLHTHSKRCYDETGALICGQLEVLEHQHQDGCFQSTGEGGSETPAQPEEEETPASRLLEAVKGELGYTEDEDGHTLYGEHYARGDEPWNVMFVAYCLEKAEITAMPSAEDVLFDCDLWRAALQAQELYQSALTYTPAPGELVFLDEDGDNIADLVAVVEKVTDERVEVIAGDLSDGVRRADYSLDDDSILGYAQLPEDEENPVEDDDPKQEEGPKDDTGEETPDKDEPADDEKEEEDAPAQGLAGRVLAAAVGQIGYAAAEDGTTLYGEFYDRADAPWNVMFAAYCLEQAGVAELPLAAAADFACDDWLAALTGAELFREGGAYTPAPGDLAFFDLDEDGAADFVAIVEKIAANRLHLIAGDVAAGCVKRSSWALDDAKLVGYVQLAEQADEQETPAEETKLYQTAEDSPVQATVTFAKESKISKDAVLTVSPITETLLLADPEEDSGKASYALLKEQAEQAVGKQAAQFALYDISFYTPDEKYIPVTESATVSLRLEGDAFKAAEQIAVLHYPAGQEEPAVLENVVWETDEDGITTVTFQTDGFSVFGIMALAEDELAAQGENNSFTLTYNNDSITFNLVDTEGNELNAAGALSNIAAEGAKQYMFGNLAPQVSGYTYSHATYMNKTVASVATTGFTGSGSFTTNFRIYEHDPIQSGKWYSVNAGTIKLIYTQNADNFDGRTLAIVTRVNNVDYALTTDSADVNGVGGLRSKVVTVDTRNNVSQDITTWTFKSQTDGTYKIFTIVTNADGTTGQQYLRLCETHYDGDADDGRGSLTLTSVEDDASSITVSLLGDGRVTLKSGSSNINLDNETQIYWCYDKTDTDNSKHLLCSFAPDYSGSWIIVNRKSASSGVAMQAEKSTERDGMRAGATVSVTKDDDTDTYMALNNGDITVWDFEKQEDGTYFISTSVISDEGKTTRKYLTISGANVTLSETAASITVLTGTGDYAGMVRLKNSAGQAVNLYGGDSSRGFGGYNDNGENEWHTLCSSRSSFYDTVTTTVNHPSSVINLFDYWIDTQTAHDNVDTTSGENGDANRGINSNHTLKFNRNGKLGTFNQWTGSKAVYPGIVQNLLGSNGYPVLAVGGGEPLDYLFDPEDNAGGYKESHRNVSGLLQVDENGYYYYNSQENFAEYDEDTNSFTLYSQWGVKAGGTSPDGQFFPFNKMNEVAAIKSTDEPINHYLGLTLTTRFAQQYGGHTTSSRITDTVFDFAGDDDVWIFIDDVLVADLGGIHDAASVSINFASGKVTINDGAPTTLRALFEAANVASNWSGDTFADNTYHTLKFFYLERGNTDSNLYLKYNLKEVPLTGIYKVNQYSNPVAGAKFAVYPSNSSYTYDASVPAYEGTTDANGEMIFVDQDDMPYSLSELERMFGEYFVLKEVDPPENYSIVSDEIHLHISNGLLLCENTYESGVWAAATLQVEAPHELLLADGNTKSYYDLGGKGESHGTLFAVVLKYSGDGAAGLENENNWSPVYGTDKDGYELISGGGRFIDRVIEAANKQIALPHSGYNDVCFTLASSGAMQLEMPNLPGNVSNYYYMLEDGDKGKTQYTIGYYWTEGELGNANANNTFRVKTEETHYVFDRVFGATIEVPNLLNRLFVQKLNEEGERVNGATFALYSVEEEEKEQIYYIAKNGEKVKLLPENKASVDGDEGYTYQISTEAGSMGNIIVQDANGSQIYVIEPKQTAITREGTFPSGYPSGEDGTASFWGIANGKYYLREIAAPIGYQLNSTEVMILVNDLAVYANAGTQNDGVTVARGPGYLVDPLARFASKDQIDNTLTWVYEKLRTSDESHTFTAYDNGAWEYWKYQSETPTYLEYDLGDAALFNYTVNVARYDSGGAASMVRRRLYTDVGWSYYELYQDYDFGSTHHGNANYENLGDQEIANLFSRSIYVQVTDEKVDGTLEISKTVAGKTSDNTMYKFTVSLRDAENNLLTGKHSYKIYEKDQDGQRNEIENGIIEGGKGTISLQHDQVAVINDLPAGTKYTVTEEVGESADYIVSAIRDNNKDVLKGKNAGHQTFSKEVFGTLYWNITKENGEDVLDNTSTVDFTNTYLTDLTIHKVSAVSGSSLSGAVFVLYRIDENQAKQYYSPGEESDGESQWKEAGTDDSIPENCELISDENGLISIKDIEDGTYFLKELTPPTGYYLLTEEIEVNVDNRQLIPPTNGYSQDSKISISKNKLMLTVPNQTGAELPETGGTGTQRYPLGGAVIMAAALACSMYRRRKKGGM